MCKKDKIKWDLFKEEWGDLQLLNLVITIKM